VLHQAERALERPAVLGSARVCAVRRCWSTVSAIPHPAIGSLRPRTI
jgi:hypothetical protein